jgi:hypothetical protein
MAWLGKARQARQGQAGHGKARQARLGKVRQGITGQNTVIWHIYKLPPF